tara:strand:- start:54 stop:566 length:513 start_codon:yes stop_codon:yes gene_type:complete
MRITKAYWLWGLFPSKETNFLNKIKIQVQSVLKSPDFETHITLTGPYLNIDNLFLDKLKTYCDSNTLVLLDIDGYNFQQEKFKSFYISIKNSENLKKLRRNIYKLNELCIENNYSPHISLSYGNHEIKEKKELISKLPKFNNPIKLSKIALVEVDEDINLWKILETFDLN